MDAPDFLPLGSVVEVRGNDKKLMIVSRGVSVPRDQGMVYVDYGGCLYPEGMMSDILFYFNHEDIKQVVFKGFHDEENAEMVKTIDEALRFITMDKAHPDPLTQEDINQTVEDAYADLHDAESDNLDGTESLENGDSASETDIDENTVKGEE